MEVGPTRPVGRAVVGERGRGQGIPHLVRRYKRAQTTQPSERGGIVLALRVQLHVHLRAACSRDACMLWLCFRRTVPEQGGKQQLQVDRVDDDASTHRQGVPYGLGTIAWFLGGGGGDRFRWGGW